MLLEYIYLSQQDEEDIRLLWQDLSQETEQVTLLGLDFESEHHAIGCIQKAQTPNHARYLYFYHNTAIIVIEQKYATNTELTEILLNLADKLSKFDSIISHTSLLLNPSEETSQIFTNHYNITNFNSNKFAKGGTLQYYNHVLQDFHQIMLLKGQYDEDLLLRDFPALMANVLNLSQKMNFYKEQTYTISYEKTQLDAKVGAVMRQNFMDLKDNKSKLELLEEMVNSLGQVYITFSSNAAVLLNIQTVFEKEHHVTNTKLHKVMTDQNNYFHQKFVIPAEEFLKDTYGLIKQIQISISNAKTSIDILQAQINLIRSNDNLIIQQQMRQVLNQNLELQQEAVTLQIGAGLIEFIVVMYYSLSIWKTLAPDSLHHIPGAVSFIIVFSFAALVVWGTHKTSKHMINKKHQKN